jgi:transposase
MILAKREALILVLQDVKVRALGIQRLQLLLARYKARRKHFGQSSERRKLLVEQLELAIEDRGNPSRRRERGLDRRARGGERKAGSRAACSPQAPR